MGLSFMNMLGLVKCMYRTYSTLLKILPCALYYKSSVSPGFAEQIMPVLRVLRYNGTLVTLTVVSLTPPS
jgi:hypothetical protein